MTSPLPPTPSLDKNLTEIVARIAKSWLFRYERKREPAPADFSTDTNVHSEHVPLSLEERLGKHRCSWGDPRIEEMYEPST
jgi:hypothetical protein